MDLGITGTGVGDPGDFVGIKDIDLKLPKSGRWKFDFLRQRVGSSKIEGPITTISSPSTNLWVAVAESGSIKWPGPAGREMDARRF
jgi:hypothetical protein